MQHAGAAQHKGLVWRAAEEAFTVCMHTRPCCLREEFTNYMFLERAQEAAGMSSENWRLFPQVGGEGHGRSERQGQLDKQEQHGD